MPHASTPPNLTTSPQGPLNIAILGGGIGGLALAIGLTTLPSTPTTPLTVTVYESHTSYTDIGSGLALHMNALRSMDLIDARIKKTYFAKALGMAGGEDVEMTTQVILAAGAHSGELVAELGRARGRKTVARADLLEGLLGLLPRGTVRFGMKIAKIAEEDVGDRISLEFADGIIETADVLIGSDGVHSVTRAYLLGPSHPATQPQNKDGWTVTNRMVPMDEARQVISEKWKTTVPIFCGPAGHMNSMPLHMGKTLSVQVVRRKGEMGDGDGGVDAEAEFNIEPWGDYIDDARALVGLVAASPTATWSPSDHDHAPFYHKGRICMMGDAAHAAMPFVGNGAAQALEDAAVLTALFRSLVALPNSNPNSNPNPNSSPNPVSNVVLSNVEKAFAAYDAVRIPRTQRVVEMGREFGRMYGFALGDIHEDPVRMKKRFAESAAFTNNFDVEGQNRRAVEIFEQSL